MYVLMLNDMRLSKSESLTEVCQAETIQELRDFVESEKVELYSDGRFRKGFRRGGPLEWCNYPSDFRPGENYVSLMLPPTVIELKRRYL